MSVTGLPATVREHFGAMPHCGVPPSNGVGWRRAEAGRERFGTRIRWWLKMEHSRVQWARFQAYGCPYTLAACEWLARELERVGPAHPAGDLMDLVGSPRRWAQVLEIPEARIGRLLVIEDALRLAIADSAVTQAG